MKSRHPPSAGNCDESSRRNVSGFDPAPARDPLKPERVAEAMPSTTPEETRASAISALGRDQAAIMGLN